MYCIYISFIIINSHKMDGTINIILCGLLKLTVIKKFAINHRFVKKDFFVQRFAFITGY